MNASSMPSPSWTRWWLWAAGIYNLLWGLVTILWPNALFDLTGITRVNYPEIWQCVGMIVGVYGLGYIIAAGDSRTHWPIVLVGFLGKIFGPMGFVVALWRGTFPPSFGLTIVTNDLIWWIPFAMILWDAMKHPRSLNLQKFSKQSKINAPREAVFQFHERPDALMNLIPPWEKMKPVNLPESLMPGTRVVLDGKVGIFPVRWVAVHTEYDPPNMFADRQESGPFAYWHHRHYFIDDGQGGSVLKDEIEYAVPLGAFGQFLMGWLIRRKLDAMFSFRHQKTQAMVESNYSATSNSRA